MKTVLLCATRRGLRVLERLAPRIPRGQLAVFSFREEPGEPPFFNEIRNCAISHGAEFREAKQVGGAKVGDFWACSVVGLILVVSWRYLIPKSIYSLAKQGAYVFHDSLLPAYRGFAPTVWAIVNGEPQTGVTLFCISEDMDAGDVVAQEPVPIGPRETIAEVIDRVTNGYLELLDQHFDSLCSGMVCPQPQDHRLATYTCRRVPEDNVISWSDSTTRIFNLIRAVTRPYPGALTTQDGAPLRIWAAEPIAEARHYVGRVPGRIVEVRPDFGTVVLTGDGRLLLREVQLAEGPPVNASTLLNSLSHTLGS